MYKRSFILICLLSLTASIFAGGTQEKNEEKILRIGASSNGP